MTNLTALDRERIARAIAAAEARTSGEIAVALAGEVSGYREVPLAIAAALALFLPPAGVALGLSPLTLAGDGWLAAGPPGELLRYAVWAYATAQVVLFAVILAIVSAPAIRRALTPAVLKRARVARAAHHQFAAIAAHATQSETGVLIFVALIDRQVQVLADAAIHLKCGEAPWSEAAQAIAAAMKHGADPTGGIVQAVEIVGAALAAHFPGQAQASGPMEV